MPGMAGTLGSILAEVAGTLATAGGDQPRRRARQLVAGALGLSATELLMHPESAIGRSETARLLGFARRLTRGEPLSRVLGRREFWGLDFTLSDETLDPRPESETIVEAVLVRVSDRASSLRLLDLGSGTGCLLLALLSELRAATGFGVDLSKGAVATACRNAQALGLAGRARFFVGDWGSALARGFDVVVTNPPYIATAALAELPREVNAYDPRRALDGGEDGLGAYRNIVAHLPTLLAPFAIFVAEVGQHQAGAVAMLLERCGLYVEAIERDLAGVERCVVARKIAGDKAEPSADVEKNLGMCGHPV
jgi:release factor glutamine methyltransferase